MLFFYWVNILYVFIIINVNRERVFLFDSEYQTSFLEYIMTNSSSSFKKSRCFFAMLTFMVLVACGGQNEVAGLVSDSDNGLSDDVEDESPAVDDTLDDDIPSDEGLNETFEVGKPTALSKKVFIHYLPWFGEGEQGRHWADGVITEPLIGYYDSQSWATHLYHILLSSAVGIDGAIINVRTEYDQLSFDKFVATIDRIDEIYPDFVYDVSISYDDQDTTVNSSTADFTYLKESIIPNTSHYLYKDEKPVVFIWNYDGFLSAQEYRDIANTVFTDNPPVLIKNEIDVSSAAGEFVMNSFYPWVQGWAEDGSMWGEEYINWFYNTQLAFKEDNKIEFVVGAVWPGFDDRNVIWGQNRWIDREGGDLYNTLWALINNTYVTDVDWVILETWNDFNEGSELEPTVGSDSYQFMTLTANHIEVYKETPTLIDDKQWMFDAAIKIYEAAKLIENSDRDYDTYYPKLQESMELYLKTNGQKSYNVAEEIIIGS